MRIPERRKKVKPLAGGFNDERTIHGLKGWTACYEKAQLKGTVFAGGVSGAGDIDGHPALKKAFGMGKSIQ